MDLLQQIIKRNTIKFGISSFSQKGIDCLQACVEDYSSSLSRDLLQSKDIEFKSIIKNMAEERVEAIDNKNLEIRKLNNTIIDLNIQISTLNQRVKNKPSEVDKERIRILEDSVKTLNDLCTEYEKELKNKTLQEHKAILSNKDFQDWLKREGWGELIDQYFSRTV